MNEEIKVFIKDEIDKALEARMANKHGATPRLLEPT